MCEVGIWTLPTNISVDATYNARDDIEPDVEGDAN